MENFLIQTEIEIQKNKIKYDVHIELLVQSDNCIHCLVKAKGSALDIYLIRDESIYFGYYYMFAIPFYNLSLPSVPNDLNYIRTFLSRYIENKIDCNTLAEVIVFLLDKWEKEENVLSKL